jgi:UDP:flavonoid glycosyltransferase YjiC (YdhE family)
LSRILLAWELGSNLGHVSRLLPLGRRLRAHGHSVLAVVRDLALAAGILGPAGIPFIQAPQMTGVLRNSSQPVSYADLLRYIGWGDPQQLWGMTQAWINVFRMFVPDAVILDHSPTALLAARCTTTPCVAIGTGFELPPLQTPLPSFPGVPGTTAENAARAESLVLENANRVMEAAGGARLEVLLDLFQTERRWLTTFAELDHYGTRPSERYVGPIGAVEGGQRLDWPAGSSHRIFAYVRPQTPDLPVILRSLAGSDSAVVCYGPGIPSEQTAPLASARFIFASQPVDLASLLPEASLCVSYAPAGTVTSTLLRGVPQLLAPAHIEAQLTAHRVECIGAGLTLRDGPDEQRVTALLHQLLNSSNYATRAAAFAAHHRGFDSGHAADTIVDDIECLASRRQQSAPPNGSGLPVGR